jgi:hypothetical protein
VAIAGGAVLGMLFYSSLFAHSLATGPQLTASMPGALLLGMTAVMAIAAGGHLMISRRPSRR